MVSSVSKFRWTHEHQEVCSQSFSARTSQSSRLQSRGVVIDMKQQEDTPLPTKVDVHKSARAHCCVVGVDKFGCMCSRLFWICVGLITFPVIVDVCEVITSL